MILADEVRAARRVFIAGNGGSAANALHIANDLLARGVRAHALTGDCATLTAIANDHGYEHVFSRQLAVLAEPGDLLIVLSGSGASPNILRALDEAKRIGMRTVAITGTFGTHAAALKADFAMLEGTNMQEAENLQIMIGHDLYRSLA